MKLYELSAAYAALLETEDAEAFAVALNQLAGAIDDKAEGVAAVIRQLEGEAEMFDAEARRLAVHARERTGRVASLKAYLLDNLERAGLDRAGGRLFTVALQASPPSVKVVDAAAVPDAFQKVIPASIVVDAQAVLAHWRQTRETPPGVEVQQGKHVRIR